MAQAKKQPGVLERRITNPERPPARRKPKPRKNRRQIATQIRRHRRPDGESVVNRSQGTPVQRAVMLSGAKHLGFSLLFGLRNNERLKARPRPKSFRGCAAASLRSE